MMRRKVSPPVHAVFLLLIALFLQPSSGQAAVHERSLPLGAAWDKESASGRWLTEILAEPEADRALAPTLTWWWALADGEEVLGVELAGIEEEHVASLGRVPGRLPLVSGEGNVARAEEGTLFDSDYELHLSPPRLLHGRAFQSVTLTPLRVEAGGLFALEAASLRLETGSATRARNPLRPLRDDFPLRQRILTSLGHDLLNPESLPILFDRAAGGAGFPTEVPSVEGAAVDMVIVTVDSFADLCQPYADYKTEYGVATVVRSMEWIAERYPFGSDRAELLRNFLQDAYAKWSISYVLLVGDAEQIPPRYAFSDIFVDPRTTPTDMYYACMDGDWNADHDHLWAEAADSTQGDWGDEADLLAELSVGRFPSGTRVDCEWALNKSRAYQDKEDTSYQDRILMLAEVLFPPDWAEGDPIYVDGAEYCESIYVKYTGPEQHVVRLFQNVGDYPGSEPLTVSAALDSMNNGFGIVLHNGHGARQTMSVGDGSIDAGGAAGLVNGDKTFLLYMVNCTAAAFDFDCIAETFLENQNGGAFGVIGSTRETFANVSDQYMNVFFERLWNDPSLRLGEAYYASMNALEYKTIEDGGFRWAHTTYTLLADPSIWQDYQSVELFVVDHPVSVPIDGNPVTLTVETFGMSPVPDALVTLRKGEEDYQRARTDESGQASFTLNPENEGAYQIRVSARDMIPYEGSLWATLPIGEPLLTLASVTVDDTSDGTVLGNGNGVAERGETVRLQLEVQNNGDTAATTVTSILRTEHPGVALIDSTDSFGGIPAAGGSAVGSDPCLIEVLDVADDEILTFTIEITCDQSVRDDDFFLETASPLLTLHRSVIDDVTGGNGDGDLDVGETADIAIQLSNYGRGTGQDVQALIEIPVGSSLTIQDGDDVLGDLPPLSIELGPAEFNVRRISADPPLLDLLLTDLLGRTDTLAVLLERPVGVPAAPEYEFGSDFSRIRVNWEPAAEEDAAAYIVLRADAPGGPYAEISEHWLESSTFVDSGLDVFTSYWYRVQPLSAGGVAGALSDSSEVVTNLALLPGWPVSLATETSSTPLVADVDGDGDFEILVGAERIYGFNPDGTELSDGDGDPSTVGPISPLGNGFAGALAATDLTSSPGLELVAASWGALEVYVFEFTLTENGTEAALAPGWPQSVHHGDGIWASPSLGDVDGDGDVEIFVTETGGAGALMAWHHDGSELIDGDDDPGTTGIFHDDMGSWPRSTAAFADIDDDGDLEIFIGTSDGYLKGFQGDGSDLDGFPFHASGGEIFSSPSIGDVDGDGFIEIVFPAENDSLYVLNHDGSRHPDWPIFFKNDNWALAPSAALADVTGDGHPEIFAASFLTLEHSRVAWIDSTGSYLPGWPIDLTHSSQSSPVVGDLDGDGDFEVVLGNEVSSIEAWHHDGTTVGGFPIVTGNHVRATPLLADVDKNGSLDMVAVGWDKNVYLWTYSVPFDAEMLPWYAFMHDQKRTGNYDALDWIVGVDEDDVIVPGAIRLDPNFPNPFNPSTQIRFTVGDQGTQSVQLSILDVRGRRVALLVDEHLPPGSYLRSWDGRDNRGRAQSSGIYFARLRMGEQVECRKMTLLK